MKYSTLHALCVKVQRLLAKGGVASDDARMSLRFIASVINEYRKKGIQLATDFGKDSALLRYVEMDLGCKPLCEVDKSECPEYLWGCTVKKVCPEFRFLSLPEHRGITYVGLIDKGHSFVYADPSNISVKKRTKVGKLISFWYLLDGNIYIVPSERLQWIEVIDLRGIPENPQDVDDCFNPDYDVPGKERAYPIINSDEADMLKYVLHELGFSMQTTTDLVNNAKDDTGQS